MAFNGIMPVNTDVATPHPYGIFSVPGFVQHTGTDDRWVNGFQVEQLLCRGSQTAFMACLPAPANETFLSTATPGTADPVSNVTGFTVVQGIACSTAGFNYDEAVKTAKLVFAAGLQQAVEHALLTGVYTNELAAPAPGNHPLDNLTITTPVSIEQAAALTRTDTARPAVPALAYLEHALAVSMPVVNTIHITPSVAAVLAAAGAIAADSNGVMRTTGNGNVVVIGTGYTGDLPEHHATGYTPASDEGENGRIQWIYGTGPLLVHLSEPEVLTQSLKDTVDVTNNTALIVIAQTVAIHWDGCSVVAVKTSLY